MKLRILLTRSLSQLLLWATAISLAVTGAAATQAYLMWQTPTTGVSYPIYVYNSAKVQVGYLWGPAQQAFIGPWPSKTSETFQLYYSGAGGTSWFSCTVSLANGSINPSNTTCPGAVVNPPPTGSNAYTLALGASAWNTSQAPANPVPTNYGNRKITLVNKTGYKNIWVGEHCTLSKNPNNPNCVNSEDRFEIHQGRPVDFFVDNAKMEGANFPAGLVSFSFTMTAYQDDNGHVIHTGGYGVGQKPYATKVEPTELAVNTVNGLQIPQGANNIDASLVDGYNIGVKVYPASPAYCTYTVPPENSNVLGVGLYSSSAPLAKFDAPMRNLCQRSSQLPRPGKGGWDLMILDTKDKNAFEGCMSPCTYATANNSPEADAFCCTGAYNSPTACTAPLQSSYVTNLKPPVSNHMYRFAYDDAIGDFACPAETNIVVEFIAEHAL